MTDVLTQKGRSHTKQGEHHANLKAEVRVLDLPAKEHQRFLVSTSSWKEARKEEGGGPCCQLGIRPLACRTVRQ